MKKSPVLLHYLISSSSAHCIHWCDLHSIASQFQEDVQTGESPGCHCPVGGHCHHCVLHVFMEYICILSSPHGDGYLCMQPVHHRQRPLVQGAHERGAEALFDKSTKNSRGRFQLVEGKRWFIFYRQNTTRFSLTGVALQNHLLASRKSILLSTKEGSESTLIMSSIVHKLLTYNYKEILNRDVIFMGNLSRNIYFSLVNALQLKYNWFRSRIKVIIPENCSFNRRQGDSLYNTQHYINRLVGIISWITWTLRASVELDEVEHWCWNYFLSLFCGSAPAVGTAQLHVLPSDSGQTVSDISSRSRCCGAQPRALQDVCGGGELG